MLMQTRKVGEGIVIGNDIEITVVEICRDKVRLSIDGTIQDVPRSPDAFEGIKRVSLRTHAAESPAVAKAGNADAT